MAVATVIPYLFRRDGEQACELARNERGEPRPARPRDSGGPVKSVFDKIEEHPWLLRLLMLVGFLISARHIRADFSDSPISATFDLVGVVACPVVFVVSIARRGAGSRDRGHDD